MQDRFEEGEYIVREGQAGDTFYMIAEGQVSVTQRILGFDEPQPIRVLRKGEFFGEKALLTEESRTASISAVAPGVEVLTLNREYVCLLDHIQYKDTSSPIGLLVYKCFKPHEKFGTLSATLIKREKS